MGAQTLANTVPHLPKFFSFLRHASSALVKSVKHVRKFAQELDQRTGALWQAASTQKPGKEIRELANTVLCLPAKQIETLQIELGSEYPAVPRMLEATKAFIHHFVAVCCAFAMAHQAVHNELSPVLDLLPVVCSLSHFRSPLSPLFFPLSSLSFLPLQFSCLLSPPLPLLPPSPAPYLSIALLRYLSFSYYLL
jgi:hypothetical protein